MAGQYDGSDKKKKKISGPGLPDILPGVYEWQNDPRIY